MSYKNKSEKINENSFDETARYRTLLEINNAIITNLRKEDLLSAVFSSIRRVLPFDTIALGLYDAKIGDQRLFALDGNFKTGYFEVNKPVSTKSTISSKIFDYRQPLFRSDLETEREYEFENYSFAEGIRSQIIIPLVAQGEAIGSFGIGSKQKAQYTITDMQFLQEIGNQIALAVVNMRAFEEIADLKSQLQAENIYLQEELLQEHNFEEIIGNSPALLDVLQKVECVAPTDATVLITGETGTGKELVARATHNLSKRKNRPLVKINCGAISAGLVESELFGHKKGAFTGAIDNRVGRFELANGGTVFLDEIGELPLETQVKLLRVLQEGEFESVGSSRTIKVDVRVIAATNRILEEEIKTGKFRSDLFYRLNVFPIHIPPLRERREDIPPLVMFFVERFSKKFGKQIKNVPIDVMNQFIGYDWTGNVRELQNIIERAAVLAPFSATVLKTDLLPFLPINIQSESLPANSPQSILPNTKSSASVEALNEVESRHILSVLEKTKWVIEGAKGAARILNLHPNTLRSRLKKLGIKRPKF